MQSLGLLIQQRLITDIAHPVDPQCNSAALQWPCRHRTSAMHAASLTGHTRHRYDGGGLNRPHPDRFLSLHRHSRCLDVPRFAELSAEIIASDWPKTDLLKLRASTIRSLARSSRGGQDTCRVRLQLIVVGRRAASEVLLLNAA